MDLDNYIFADDSNPEWLVEHHYSTGSTMDGTRRHYWHAVRFKGYALAKNVTRTYPSYEEAKKVADRYTANNEEP